VFLAAMANVVPLDHRKAIESLEVKVNGLEIDSKDEDSFKSNASTVCRWPLDDLGIQVTTEPAHNFASKHLPMPPMPEKSVVRLHWERDNVTAAQLSTDTDDLQRTPPRRLAARVLWGTSKRVPHEPPDDSSDAVWELLHELQDGHAVTRSRRVRRPIFRRQHTPSGAELAAAVSEALFQLEQECFPPH